MACDGTTQPTLGIVTGLQFEAALLRRTLKAYAKTAQPPAICPPSIWIICAGPGRMAAEQAAKDLIAKGATALMSLGLAGGLDPALPPGALILASHIVNAEGDSLPTDDAWRARARARLGDKIKLIDGILAESGAPLASPAEKARLRTATNALAVDMESYGVARAAERAGLPFLAMRAIADRASDPLPPASLAGAAPDGGIHAGPVLKELMRRPTDLPALLRLARASAAAQKSLRDFARLGLPFFGLV